MRLYDVLVKNKKATTPIAVDAPYSVPEKKTSLRHGAFWGGIVVVCIAIYTAGNTYTRAHVIIRERRIPFSLTDAHFVLIHESKAIAGDIPFQIIKVIDQSSREVIGTQAPFTTVTIKKTTPILQSIKTKKSKKTIALPILPAPLPVVIPKLFTYQVPDTERESIANTLSSDVFERLKRQTRTQIPAELLLPEDLQFFFFDKNKIVFTGNTIAFPAIAHGTLVSYLIDKNILEQAIATEVLHDEETYPEVSIPEIGSLQIKAISAVPIDPDSIPDEFTVSITGTGTIITTIFPSDIQKQLVGVSRNKFDTILSKIKEIDSGSYSMYPFWARYFPLKKDRISVEVD
jgi:hypothetical protein